MSTQSPRPAVTTTTSATSWGIALAAGSLLLVGGGMVVWSAHDTDPPGPQPGAPDVTVAMSDPQAPLMAEPGGLRRALPLPGPELTLHTVAYAIENGTRVVKIKVVETGDELVVDAATGRLLEARPSRPTAPPPVGKFAAPFDPMT
jgi:hypothetical protein